MELLINASLKLTKIVTFTASTVFCQPPSLGCFNDISNLLLINQSSGSPACSFLVTLRSPLLSCSTSCIHEKERFHSLPVKSLPPHLIHPWCHTHLLLSDSYCPHYPRPSHYLLCPILEYPLNWLLYSALQQCFSTFLVLQPFNTVPHVVVISQP